MKRRVRQLNFRVTVQEKAALEAAAAGRGFRGVTEYLRACAFAGSPPTDRTFTVVIHPAGKGETGFWAEVPALPGCNSQGESYAETVSNVREAIVGYLRMLLKRGEPIPSEKQPKERVVTAVKVAV